MGSEIAVTIVEGGKDAEGTVLKRAQTFGPSGMTITIQNLSYKVVNHQNKKETISLLHSVTGYFKPREMTALMGPSGSSKTTLLDLLAGRKTVGKTEGHILFAGNKPTQQFLRRYTGYVEQFDTLLPILTVEEMLLYTAELKRPRSEPLAEKKAAVDRLLARLALTPCRSVKIGNPLEKGISGGQAKRTNIGIALITAPRVLFLDEPTSGLDSFTANEVMTAVKGLTADGVTIIATIHSPTAYAFSLFDSLMMLIKGRVVFFGPTADNAPLNYVRQLAAPGGGATAAAIATLPTGATGQQAAALGAAQQPQVVLLTKQQQSQLEAGGAAGLNPAEWLVDLFTQADRLGQGALHADAYDASALKQNNEEVTALLCQQQPDLPAHVQAQLATRSETVTPWWWGLRTLIKYRTTHNYRDGAFLGPRIGDKVIMGLLIMTLYLGIGDDFSPSNLINIAAVMFMWVTMPAFGAASYVPAIVLERNLFVRERADGLYRVFTYLAAKMIDELAINCIVSVVIAAIAFYGIQLQGSFLLFWLVYLLTLCVGVSLAYFVAALSPNMDVANAALPTYVAVLLFFVGFLFTYDKMPPWWKWFSYINPLRYSWTAVMLNQFEAEDPLWIGQETLLQYYGMAGQSKWANLAYVAAFFVFFLTCAWLTLAFKRHQKR